MDVMRTVPWPVFVVTFLLFLNAGLAGAGVLPGLVHGISALGILVVPWMVIHVLRDTSVPVRELGDDEWGYQDRPDLRPGG